MGVWFEIIFALILAGYSFSLYLKKRYSYWKDKGVPSRKPVPILGNFHHALTLWKSGPEIIKELYNCSEFRKQPFGGIYIGLQPALFLRDPELIKSVLMKDFQHFKDRGVHKAGSDDLLNNSLFFLWGWRWRSLRAKLIPAFSSGKMKNMFHLMLECSEKLEEMLNDPATKRKTIDVKDHLTMFTTDIIGSCAFGLTINSMNNPDNEFRRMGRRVFQPTTLVNIQRTFLAFFPFLSRYFTSTVAPKSVADFFTQMVSSTVRHREDNDITRYDFMQLLINIKNKKQMIQNDSDDDDGHESHYVEDKNRTFDITDDIIAAQAFVFFLAGFETSSSAISFILHELALNPDIQDNLVDEIRTVLRDYGGKLTYEGIQSMKYLDQVVSEGLRKYPPLASLKRRCNKTYYWETYNLVIEKGTDVILPVFGLHYDPKYYPEPEKFDPERFSPTNKKNIHQCVYLPFGEGPRMCIGMRFGLLQTKIGLVTLLKRYKFEISDKSTVPTEFGLRSAVTSLKGGVWLKIKNRNRYGKRTELENIQEQSAN